MRRNVDVPKHSKKRARSKIDPISINMYEVFANGRGRTEGGSPRGKESGNETGDSYSSCHPPSPASPPRTAGDREMLSETVVIA